MTKPEFPWLYAKASTAVATPMLGVLTATYAQHAISQRPADTYPVGMAAFGVTAAFAAICYAVPQSDGGLSAARYAGEKFLHSSLLLVQSLMVIYAKNLAITHAPNWGQPWSSVAAWLGGFAGVVAALVAVSAARCWYWGFEQLNAELWKNWERRLQARIHAFDRQAVQTNSSPPKGSTP